MRPRRSIAFKCPILHDLKSHAFAFGQKARQSGSSVFDTENDVSTAGSHADEDILGLAMFDGVRNRFLRDSIQVRGHVVILHQHGGTTVKLAPAAKHF